MSEREFHQLSPGRLRAHDLDAHFHGIRSVGLDIGFSFERARIYAPRLRSGQLFCGVTAAQLWEIPLPLHLQRSTTVHVGDLRGSVPRTKGVIGHALRYGDRRDIQELPLVSPAQTWCQLAAVLSREDLVAAGDFLITGKRRPQGGREAPLCSLDDLDDAATRIGRQPGAANVRWALPRLRRGADSRPESLWRLTLVAHRLPEPVVQHPVSVAGGLVLHPDLAYPTIRLGIEYEGEGHRTDKKQWRADLRRVALFEDAGWRIIHVTQADLDDPTVIVGIIRRALRNATK
ncbi:hypothetical protein ACX9R5_02065 [Rathayibacter sp. CAU 1779]